MLLTKIRKAKGMKTFSLFMAFTLLFQFSFPIGAFALTGGPSQPEVQSFEPIGTSEMVDPFSGDFTYNIPLMDVGGYPINISYNANSSNMDAEATWVGAGWNLNMGVANRSMRALPDDFKGDQVKREFNVLDNQTYGVSLYPSWEFFGLDFLSFLKFGLGFSYNNYTGVGFNVSANPSLSSGAPNKTGMTAGLGLSASSTGGVGISPSVSFRQKVKEGGKKDISSQASASLGVNYNSRAGLTDVNFSATKKRSSNNIKLSKMLTSKGYVGYQSMGNGGASISFVTNTYTPQLSMPMLNTGVSFEISLGGALFGTHPLGRINGYYSGQYLMKNEDQVPAYGYLYTHESNGKDKAMLDFNRENDGSFNKYTPVLPVTSFTYDMLSISGQGIGGMYRPYRSDIGILFDNEVKNYGGNLDVPGLEIGAGGLVHGGLNTSVNFTNSKSGKWKKHNSLKDVANFRGATNDPLYEPAYYKQAGEKTPENDSDFFNQIGGYDPVKVGFNTNPRHVHAQAKFIKQNGQEIPVNANNTVRKKRDQRNETVSTLTAAEATKFGLNSQLEIYTTNDFSLGAGAYENRYQPTLRPRQDSDRKAHHISEIQAFRADGARYIYGLPLYNLYQEDVSFAIEGGSPDCLTGLVNYASGTDDSKGNNKGRDHYFDRTIMPPFAHSFLLTSVLSTDYQDLTGNGPSDDDIGSYTKINYAMIADKANPYHWRVPFQQGKANFNEGFKHDSNDNKASYLYGQKELAYVHSIETKTHVAEFTLADRADGYGVTSNAGGAGNMPYKLLKKITLFAKPDKVNNANPIPIKEVHFDYDYELCPSIHNNDGSTQDPSGHTNQGGKLTLKSIHFTYGKSQKGKLSPYNFEYGQLRNADGSETIINPSYNMKAYDRWGNFKPNNTTGCTPTSPITTSEFPYTPQEALVSGDQGYDPATPRSKADAWAPAWNLTTINLPSGGKIKVDYEADDYAYVQNKQAMQMFKIAGTSETLASSTSDFSDKLYNATVTAQPRNYLYFKLDRPLNASQFDANAYVRDHYFKSKEGNLIDYLYFKFLTNLEIPSNNGYEYVPGYAKVDEYGVAPFQTNGAYEYGFVKIKDNNIDDEEPGNSKAQPIAQAAWNFTKINLPRVAYRQPDVTETAVVQIFKALAATFLSISDLFIGANNRMRLAQQSRTFEPEKSWIRLLNPDYEKDGGGSRVKKIAMSDEWAELTGETNYNTASYGQVYDYTKTDAYGNTISSGVASWEPTIGSDENPFKRPIFVEEKKILAPDYRYYKEKPIGESLYAGASVGYSQVTVKNLQYDDVTRNATGRVVHEFYTAQDFPTLNPRTSLQPVRKKQNPVFKLLKINNYDYMTATQGFAIELNNMHGTAKSQRVYQENKTEPISSIQYKYKTKPVIPSSVPGAIPIQRLDNSVQTIDKNGNIVQREVGIDYDFALDMREHSTQTIGAGLGGNLDAFLAFIIPIAIPIILPDISREKTRFRSATTTKVINRYGILEETIARDLGSQVATKNKLWDAETGNVLLTETVNEYDDPIFSFTYPAHWGYDRMGPTYKNQGVTVAFNSISNPNNYFVLGDEVGVSDGSTFKRAWVTQVDAGVVAQDIDGNNVPLLGTTIKVLNSGRSNMAATPIGSVATLKNPLASSLSFEEIINANAVEMKEEWGLFCECGYEPDSKFNPYVQGVLGNWRPARSYLHLTERTQSKANNNTNTRKDGIFTSFTPFWNANNGNDWTKTPLDWTFTSEVTIFSPYGFELENRDALGRYSSAIYGYSSTLPLSVAANAQYREIAFDGFEDYEYDDCPDDHFSYEGAVGVQITEEESHTGRRSIELGPGTSVEVRRVIQ